MITIEKKMSVVVSKRVPTDLPTKRILLHGKEIEHFLNNDVRVMSDFIERDGVKYKYYYIDVSIDDLVTIAKK